MLLARSESINVPMSFLAGLALSLLIHLAFVLLLIRFPDSASMPEIPPIFVEFVPPPQSATLPSEPKRQIVSPPKESDASIKTPATYESDRDSYAVREQVRRGDAPEAGAIAPKQAEQRQMERSSQKPEPQKSANSSSLQHLTLDDRLVREKFGTTPKQSSTELSNSLNSAAQPSRPFSRPFGRGALFMGSQGSNDYLPNLPDGDITLLNTKANLFAVFVRRVATQVFGQLRAAGWDLLHAGDVRAIEDDATVLATLSPKGDLLRVSLHSSSGSSRFDQVLQEAVQRGAKDPNPPNGAVASDGNIHFVFKAKSWVQFAGDPRSGAPIERRWLLLATGLD